MEIPDDIIDLNRELPHRFYGWWYLAILSIQLDANYGRQLPASEWRDLLFAENGREEHDLAFIIESRLSGMPTLAEMTDWACCPEFDHQATYFALLRAVRTLRLQAPERFPYPSYQHLSAHQEAE